MIVDESKVVVIAVMLSESKLYVFLKVPHTNWLESSTSKSKGVDLLFIAIVKSDFMPCDFPLIQTLYLLGKLLNVTV